MELLAELFVEEVEVIGYAEEGYGVAMEAGVVDGDGDVAH